MHQLTLPLLATRIIDRSFSLLFGIAVVGALSGCGKNEKIPTTADRLSSVQQKQESQPDFYAPRKAVDYMTDLKSLKDAPAKAEPAATKPELSRPAEIKPSVQESKVAATPVQAASPQPAPAPLPQPSAPANNVVASAVPTARPAPPRQDAVSVLSVISREQPAFPREALRSGIENGTVRARMTINASGEVTNVAILQAQPARVFDRSVQQALGRWKFNAGADGRTFDTEVGFKAN